MRSVLCNFIKKYPNDWESRLKEYKIRVGHSGKYAIFNYEIAADFFSPLVREARGIILDLNELKVVCWPFTKFGNHFEPYADTIDWGSAVVQEKIDGSIMKLWWNEDEMYWTFSSNSMIRLEDGSPDFRKAVEFAKKAIDFSKLEKENTYIFELVSPLTKVIVPYSKTEFYHIGTRNNRTGEELQVDIGIQKPKKYQAKSLKECIAIAEELNKGPIIEEEGFVVVDKDYHRIKVKSPKYVEAHKLKSGISKRVLIETITEPDFDAERYLLQFPEQEELILFYMDQINRLKEHVSHYAAYARDLYEQSGNSRKEVALQIKDDKFSGVGFAAIKDLEKTDEDLFRDLTEKFVLDNVEDFEFA